MIPTAETPSAKKEQIKRVQINKSIKIELDQIGLNWIKRGRGEKSGVLGAFRGLRSDPWVATLSFQRSRGELTPVGGPI